AQPETIATFSVAAYDPSTGEVGVAVQSRFFAVGSVVPWCKAGVGAVATQAFGQPEYGREGLELMEQGYTPGSAICKLLTSDDKKEQRQLGMVIAKDVTMPVVPVPSDVSAKADFEELSILPNPFIESVKQWKAVPSLPPST